MGVYSKIVSTSKQIDSIHTFIGGVRKEITSVWTFVNGEIKQLFPAGEVYTEVFAQTTGGAYSETLPFGKYKIVYSGGGGSGSSVAARTTGNIRDRKQSSGSAAQQVTVYVEVPYGETFTISGTVGTGAAGSHTVSHSSYHDYYAGTPGTGYASGTAGTLARYGHNPVLAGGSGGGSTSLFVNGVIQEIAKGGNGGGASLQYVNISETPPIIKNWSVSGGTGGSGGITNGTGAAGGAASYGAGSDSGNTSGAGANGYIYIYKSSIYPN